MNIWKLSALSTQILRNFSQGRKRLSFYDMDIPDNIDVYLYTRHTYSNLQAAILIDELKIINETGLHLES